MHLNPINLSAARLALIEHSTQNGPHRQSLPWDGVWGFRLTPAGCATAGAGPKPAAEAAQVKASGRKMEGGGASGGHRETCCNPGPG